MSKTQGDDKSKWDAFFAMDDNNSMNYSADNDPSESSEDEDNRSEYSGLYDDDSIYDSDAENKQKVTPVVGRFLNTHNVIDERSLDSSEGAQEKFSNYVNRVKGNKISDRELTLIPIGGKTQAHYMLAGPKSNNDAKNNTHIISPHSKLSVSLKQGLSNNKTKKLFQVKTKKAPEKKEFLKVHPKHLERRYDKMKEKYDERYDKMKEKYDEMKEKRRQNTTQDNDVGITINKKNALFPDNSYEEVDQYNSFKNTDKANQCDLVSAVPMLRTVSRLMYPDNDNLEENIDQAKSYEESQCDVDEKKSGKNQKKNLFTKMKSYYGHEKNNGGFNFSKDDTIVDEISIPNFTSNKEKKLPRLNIFKFGRKKNKLQANESMQTDSYESSLSSRQLSRTQSGFFSRIRSSHQDPLNFDSMDERDLIPNEMVVFYHFGGNPKKSMEYMTRNESLIPTADSEEVLVRIEASTISKTDSYIRKGRIWASNAKKNHPITPGVDFVGKVVKCGAKATELYGINVNDFVASLIQTGGNAKYIVEHANQLVKVPTKVEACNAVVLVEAYLSAFQILMLGIKGVDRYKCRPLEGKKILIIGGISTMNQAMIELSVILGAQEIYTTSLEKHVDFLQELGATTLDIEEEEWLPIVRGKIDIVVDSLCDDHYDSPWKALNSTGRLICHGIQSILNEDPGCLTSIEELWAKTKSACMTQTTKYDVYSYWEENLEESKNDLAFLFGLLEKKAIKPSIADKVTLKNVIKAHTFLEANRRIQGTFVCLPHMER